MPVRGYYRRAPFHPGIQREMALPADVGWSAIPVRLMAVRRSATSAVNEAETTSSSALKRAA